MVKSHERISLLLKDTCLDFLQKAYSTLSVAEGSKEQESIISPASHRGSFPPFFLDLQLENDTIILIVMISKTLMEEPE